MNRESSRDTVRARLLRVTGDNKFNPVPSASVQAPTPPASEPAAEQSVQSSPFQDIGLPDPHLRDIQAWDAHSWNTQPQDTRSLNTQLQRTAPGHTGTRTSAARTRLQLPGELPERLREVDLKLAAERASAVDAEELAAYLEADGLGDEILKDRYGADGLFDAAEMLYRQKGTGRALDRVPAPVTPAFPWHMLPRGPLYLLPGLAGLLIAGALGKAAESAFILAAAFGWGWTMTVAGVRYAEPFAVPGRALRTTLLVSAGAGLLGGAGVAAALGGDVLIGALVGGAVALSSGAAGVLLSLGQLGQFAGAFASPLLAAGIVMSLPSRGAALFALGLLAAVPTLTALNVTRPRGSLSASLSTLRPHLPHAVYGWAMAAAFVALSARIGTWPLLPVILGAGLLEAGVWHAQERLQVAARTLRTLIHLRRIGLPTVLLSAAGYGLALGAGLALLSVLRVPVNLNLSLLTVALYGAALLLSSWLANQRRLGFLTAIWALGAAALVLGLPPPLFALLTLLALLFPTLHTLSDPRSYR
ncbi:hypothetical protein [Deinococcus marmoris]|uniref:hypothetical protein n=1 Tax=Deinococcus marmoris TaxID=249408 RepID=UPI001FE0F2E2|nr:hypothetical protein [Deinococcus marmoris]